MLTVGDFYNFLYGFIRGFNDEFIAKKLITRVEKTLE